MQTMPRTRPARALLAPNRESGAETSPDIRRIWRRQAPQQLAERFVKLRHHRLLLFLLFHMALVFDGLRRLALGHSMLDISCGKTLDPDCAGLQSSDMTFLPNQTRSLKRMGGWLLSALERRPDGLQSFRRGRGEDVGLAVEGRDQTVDAVFLQDGGELRAGGSHFTVALWR